MDTSTWLPVLTALAGIVGTMASSKFGTRLLDYATKSRDKAATRRERTDDRYIARLETDLDAERRENTALRTSLEQEQEKRFDAELKLAREQRTSEGWRSLAVDGTVTAERAIVAAIKSDKREVSP